MDPENFAEIHPTSQKFRTFTERHTDGQTHRQKDKWTTNRLTTTGAICLHMCEGDGVKLQTLTKFLPLHFEKDKKLAQDFTYMQNL